jgi:hypothetical protein
MKLIMRVGLLPEKYSSLEGRKKTSRIRKSKKNLYCATEHHSKEQPRKEGGNVLDRTGCEIKF